MFSAILSAFMPALIAGMAAHAKANAKKNQPLATPTVISPQVTQAMSLSRKRVAKQGGRSSTIMTGGIFTNPSLLKQGLSV